MTPNWYLRALREDVAEYNRLRAEVFFWRCAAGLLAATALLIGALSA